MKNRKLTALVLAVMLALGCFTMSGCKKDDVINIGIVQLIEHDALDQATQGFIDTLTEKLGEDKVKFDVQLAQGEQANCTTIVNKFVTGGVDLIMANATNAVKAAQEATSEIPIVGTSVTDYVAAGLVASNEKPGANVTGASDMNPVGVQVELLQTLVPDAKTIGIVYCSAEENSKVQAEEAKAAFEAKGYTVNIYTVADTNEINTVVTKACSEVDAFYEPTDNLIAANVPAMSNITTPAGKPVITGEESMCKSGFLATYSISYYDLGCKAAEMAYEILVNDADPATMPIFRFDSSTLNLVINEQNAKELGIEIPDCLK
ncbi:MAG: ABC transporter substrate-binding protein [Christensenellaceae bacterium]|nr:ABC transporter substrate-binding protein [Christensenellaceae bacterium]